MEKDLDPDIIKSTQLSLGKYVKRPPLSDKLLKKPPFRFLHDIVTTVIKTTGFFGNLFEDNELVSENVKDRDSKILFLNKVIFVLSKTTGKTIAAKPSKIVAGQEPEKTNELLQCLAQALDEKLSSDEAVKSYKESSKSTQSSDAKTKEPIKSTKKANDTKKLTSRSSEKLTNQKNEVARSTTKLDKDKTNDVKSKRKENGSVKVDSQNLKKTQQSKTVNSKTSKDNNVPKDENTHTRHKNISSSNSIDKGQSSLIKTQSQESDTHIEKDDQLGKNPNETQVFSPRVEKDDEGTLNTSYTIAEKDLNSSTSSNDLNDIANNDIKDQINTQEMDVNDETQLIEPDPQIQTNNDLNDNMKMKSFDTGNNIAQERQKDQLSSIEFENKSVVSEQESLPAVKVTMSTTNESKNPRPPSVRPSSSRPGAPRMREKLDNVIKDSDNLLLGKVNIIVENTQNEEEEETNLLMMENQGNAVTSPQDQQDMQLPYASNEHGHLVQQILDSQKELSQITGKTEIEWQFGAQKAREAINQEVEQLRFNIQAMSRVANPLGKLLDHIQEDVEVMRQELHQWSNIYEDVTKEMQKQKTINEDSLTPFYTKLKQTERDIEEKHDKINDLKILIQKNALRIEKLLMSGSVQ
ncbi:TRAF3-interacting protein 1 [Spodoptera frugiperda]|uniref:TRAF3-interacting protein 1 n=1 Tax=Spodoptera frugiperda TaxID=7108 RepID=A0A9R0DE53_SPOFR|nr:TRAF3-interacting protein 1 [Spodoptera frugiperda]